MSSRHPDWDYEPPPSRGNGCVQGAMILVIGGIILVLILLIFGRQIMSYLIPDVPSIPAKIQQVVATPTTTVIDRGGTILQIKNLNRLETQSQSIERIVEAKIERGNALDIILGDKLLLIASGEVVAGVDMSKVKDTDVQLSSDGKTISIRLPPSEIFSKSLNNDRTRVYDRQQGIFAPTNKDLETQARSNAEAEILNAACENDIMQKAADEAQKNMEQFLKLAGFKSVTVTSSAGQCVAPGQT
jgi:hypothetical protein